MHRKWLTTAVLNVLPLKTSKEGNTMDLPVDEEDGSFTNISLADDPGTKL